MPKKDRKLRISLPALKAAPATLDLPPWLPEAIKHAMEIAEVTFGSGSGTQKKDYVKAVAKDLLARHDWKKVPDWIETPVEKALVEILIEGIWALFFSKA